MERLLKLLGAQIIVKMVTLPRTPYRFNVVFIKIPIAFFTETEKRNCKIHGSTRDRSESYPGLLLRAMFGSIVLLCQCLKPELPPKVMWMSVGCHLRPCGCLEYIQSEWPVLPLKAIVTSRPNCILVWGGGLLLQSYYS